MAHKKTALITGVSGQIGSNLARVLVEKEINVIGLDINEPDYEFNDFLFVRHDANNISEKRSIFDDLSQRFGDIDYLVNNVGISTFDDFEVRTEEDFDQVISTNLKSVFFDIQNFVRKFDQSNQSSAKILNIGSIFGTVSSDFRNYTDLNRKSPECYGASKAGVIQMTKYFAVHIAKRDISVNCVSPGGIFDPQNPQGEDFIKNYSHKTPMNRMANVDEIVEVISTILQIKTNYLTGQNIIVDGGLTSW